MGRMAEKNEHGWAIYMTSAISDDGEHPRITPYFKTPEELARFCVDAGIPAFAFFTATYEQWLATIRDGGAPSIVFTSQGTFTSGVAASVKKE